MKLPDGDDWAVGMWLERVGRSNERVTKGRIYLTTLIDGYVKICDDKGAPLRPCKILYYWKPYEGFNKHTTNEGDQDMKIESIETVMKVNGQEKTTEQLEEIVLEGLQNIDKWKSVHDELGDGYSSKKIDKLKDQLSKIIAELDQRLQDSSEQD